LARQRLRSGKASTRRVVELFAGVGGFRLGLEGSGWEVVWANQWEPSTKKTQHAFDCYVTHFDTGVHVNDDIAKVLDKAELDPSIVPEHELLVGGFPCQDYSVAKTLSHARGIQGKKGVLWWEILRLLRLKRPPFVLLENVDRLLKSPAHQRGRDFGIILACLAELGYAVEWRVVNAAEYGFPQRRRRVFILARPLGPESDPYQVVHKSGVLARALPVKEGPNAALPLADSLPTDLVEVSDHFGVDSAASPFRNAGFMHDFKFWTYDVRPRYRGKQFVLRDVLDDDEDVPESFYIRTEQLPTWDYLKGAKKQPRTNASGFSYTYNEGAVAFPDSLDMPSRTVLTGEGGITPSRFKHVVETGKGRRLRRLTPSELERLNGFPPGWTDTGMSDARRAFMMGNALVVGIVERIGSQLDLMADELIEARS
jgi:DNA (cytosine-5)-methyltransferase 1